MDILPIQTKIRYKLIRKLIGNASEKKVLDIGAGYRPLSRGIKTNKTIKLDGIKKYNPDIIWDINKTPWPIKENSLDLVIAGEIIEHIFNPIKFIMECHRILKKKGELILSTPNICSLKNRFKVFLNQLPEYCAEPLDNESYERHIVDFNFPTIIKILESNGFKIIKKTSNGIISHSKLLWPLILTPPSFGETIIIKAKKLR